METEPSMIPATSGLTPIVSVISVLINILPSCDLSSEGTWFALHK
jgi:hypothetical protein